MRPMHSKLIAVVASTLLLVSWLEPTAQGKGGGGGGGGGGQQQPPPPPKPPSPQELAVTAARTNLTAVTAKLKAAFDSSPEMKTALDNATAALQARDAANKKVLDSLADNADYKAAIDARTAAADAITQARDGGADPSTIADLAQNAMKTRTAVTKIETAAYAADPDASAAKAAYTAANAAVLKLRASFQASLASDADYIAAKKQLDDAVAAAGKSSTSAGG